MPSVPLKRYWVALNPSDHDALLAQQPDLADELAHHLFDLAHQAGFALPDPPIVSLAASQDVPLHQVRVTARRPSPDSDKASEGGDSTRQMPLPVGRATDADQALPTRPFLILEANVTSR